MTLQADILRDRRRRFAAPGGAHDRLIGLLAKLLPAGIGVVAAVMLLAPLSPRGEIGFLLDRRRVEVTQERIAVDHAMYRGTDNRGRLFRVEAGSAVQASPAIPVVDMRDLAAQMQLADGPAQISAPSASYNFRTESISSKQPVRMTATDGYQMVMSGVDIDLNTQMAVGTGGVEGEVPTGSFRADRIVADLDARTVALEGNARLRMVPGSLRTPR